VEVLHVIQRSSFDLLRRLWTLITPFRLQLTCLAAVVLLSIPLSLLTPVPLTLAVDSIIGSRPLPALLQAWVPLSIQQSTTALFLLMFLTFHRYCAVHPSSGNGPVVVVFPHG
jgi:hypothetical protein